ncbi:MAG TPA: replicative DNA helicase [Solirubrobacteraceae bacterium]|nr:replicative DNA helicase [Solirubrobacteraceae bacterium]
MSIVERNGGPVAPPQNLEAEQSVLGAVLLSDTALPALIIDERLQADDFYRESHGLIYQAMLDLHTVGEPVDALTLVEHLKQGGLLERAGGRAAVDLLAGSVPAVGNVRQYARIVRENAMLRRLLHASYEIQARVHSHEAPPRELVDLAERSILEVAHDDRRKDFRSIHDLLFAELDKLEKLSVTGQSITGTPSGFEDLDRITGGFQPGNLVVLAARPGMGKCLAGSSLVYDPITGSRRSIDEVVAATERGEEVVVASVGPDLRVHTSKVSAGIRSGVQSVFRVRTRLGRRLDATATHPLLTLSGWRPIAELEPGSRIGVPRRLPRTVVADETPDHEGVGNARGLERVFAYGATREVNSDVDTLPVEAWDPILLAKGAGPWAEVSVAAGHPRNHNSPDHRRGVSRPQLTKAAEATGDGALTTVAASDLWWDAIASIQYLGEQETYDLTVPGDHSFVANDIVVHNSALAANIAEHAALTKDKAVALFSLEMSEGELAQRFIASQASVKGDDLRKGKVPQARWAKILAASNRLAESALFVDDSSDLSVLDVRAKVRRLGQQQADGLGLVLVDYLQLMRATGPTDNRAEQVGQISRGLKTLARELDVPVIALSQLNRGVEQRADKRPMLSDLRESGAIEQDADLVMFIYRDEYYDDDTEHEGLAELHIAKHRNGGLGTVKLTFQAEYPRFMSYVGEERY